LISNSTFLCQVTFLITFILQNELRKISYEDGRIEQLQDERRQLLSEIRSLKEKIDRFEAR
jgi:hypothetical protein